MKGLTEAQEKRIQELLNEMTLEEKIGQMNLKSMSIVGGFDVPFEELIEMMADGRITAEEFGRLMSTAEQDYHEDDIRAGKVGALMVDDPVKGNELQKIAVEETRLGIPLLFGLDVIHGYRTVFPIAIAEAGSFEPALFEKTASMAARESRSRGINWHFAPMIDVARDARWGRVSEGPGEDPYLVSTFARHKIRGLQNDHSAPDSYIAACLKHYVAYGACESGRDYNTTGMARSLLHNAYLPPFQAAVEEGAMSAMASFNDLNGIPCTVNSFTLREMLKETFGLEGFVVSDANGIKECVNHGIAEDEADAGVQAAKAGLDMDMGTDIYSKYLAEKVESGEVSMEVIDEAVKRILGVKMWLGLFDRPYVTEEAMSRYEVLPQEHLDIALEAGKKSIVLLKNENDILPLKKDTKVSLVGTLAGSKDEVVGAWSISWRKDDCVSILDGMENAGANFEYYPCGGPEGDLNEEEIEKAIAGGDVIVAVVGELVSMSGEASSRADITLPGRQKELLTKLLASGKPVVAVFMNGRPLALEWENENLPVLVEAWHLGVQMGNAVASVLYGDTNPSGRLASTFPKVTGQCPIYYNHPNTGRPGSKSKFTSRYLDAGFEPLYPFGYGLSYTTYEYSNMQVEETDTQVIASVDVENTGKAAGDETVQLYMRDVTASIVRPVKELKGFAKVTLNPGEKKTVAISLDKANMGFFDDDRNYRLESGKFQIFLGANSRDCQMTEMNIQF
ncbi:MAG: glycoside hydrolase family 3 C-terminal domain-containing protein [Blautia sp.]|nr:glycoside hydrolase family 3 C-terminal domain-containing protein [Blautia sp.]